MKEPMSRADLPYMWRPADKYIGVCARCGCEGLKKRMTAIYVKKDSDSAVKILCHVCADCYTAFLDELGIKEG